MAIKSGTTNDDILAANYNGAENDKFFGLAGDDTLWAYGGNDSLDGGAGDDWLDGGVGADLMMGGDGSDSYVVDNANDVVIENTNPKDQQDSVESYIENYTLGNRIENLYLGYGSIIKGSGNAQDNSLNGNDNDNVLFGLNGNDTLNGGVGNDTLNGGAGKDEYWINNVGDVVQETTVSNVAAQKDIIYSTIANYTLADNVENITLWTLTDSNSEALNAVGNSSHNVMMGNEGANSLSGLAGNDSLDGADGKDSLDGGAGNDTLNGGAGIDSMVGGAGNDYYQLDNKLDSVNEVAGGGTDSVESWLPNYTLKADVENLVLLLENWQIDYIAQNGVGNELANRLQGNSSNNQLSGEAGSDTLIGSGGQDTLSGGLGNDTLIGSRWNGEVFVFNTALSASSNVDQLVSFQGSDANDVIQLDHRIFTALNSATGVTASMLITGDNVTTASDNNDFLIYNSASGALYYDADGNGTTSQPIQFIGMGTGLSLTANDFAVI